jgi:carboxylesterase
MRPVAEAFAAAGFAVELPRLPGHGTSVDDLAATTWEDWTAEAEAAYQRLAACCEMVVVAGQSMGGSLTIWLAARHPEIAGIVCVNPATQPGDDDALAMLRDMLAAGEDRIPAGRADIADPTGADCAYGATPVTALLSFQDGLASLQPDLAAVACAALILTSRQDHVVDPTDSDHLAASVRGPVERVMLERSYHVAALDYDGPLVCDAAVAFGRRVTARRPH